MTLRHSPIHADTDPLAAIAAAMPQRPQRPTPPQPRRANEPADRPGGGKPPPYEPGYPPDYDKPPPAPPQTPNPAPERGPRERNQRVDKALARIANEVAVELGYDTADRLPVDFWRDLQIVLLDYQRLRAA